MFAHSFCHSSNDLPACPLTHSVTHTDLPASLILNHTIGVLPTHRLVQNISMLAAQLRLCMWLQVTRILTAARPYWSSNFFKNTFLI